MLPLLIAPSPYRLWVEWTHTNLQEAMKSATKQADCKQINQVYLQSNVFKVKLVVTSVIFGLIPKECITFLTMVTENISDEQLRTHYLEYHGLFKVDEPWHIKMWVLIWYKGSP